MLETPITNEKNRLRQAILNQALESDRVFDFYGFCTTDSMLAQILTYHFSRKYEVADEGALILITGLQPDSVATARNAHMQTVFIDTKGAAVREATAWHMATNDVMTEGTKNLLGSNNPVTKENRKAGNFYEPKIVTLGDLSKAANSGIRISKIEPEEKSTESSPLPLIIGGATLFFATLLGYLKKSRESQSSASSESGDTESLRKIITSDKKLNSDRFKDSQGIVASQSETTATLAIKVDEEDNFEDVALLSSNSSYRMHGSEADSPIKLDLKSSGIRRQSVISHDGSFRAISKEGSNLIQEDPNIYVIERELELLTSATDIKDLIISGQSSKPIVRAMNRLLGRNNQSIEDLSIDTQEVLKNKFPILSSIYLNVIEMSSGAVGGVDYIFDLKQLKNILGWYSADQDPNEFAKQLLNTYKQFYGE
jgi:hypothetical protein